MEQLFPWVEQELRQFRRRSAEFAARYPRIAGKMGRGDAQALDRFARAPVRDAARGAGRDPHVERLIQSVAVLHARIAHSLDGSSPLLDEALLASLFPGLLRPFPSSAIFRLQADAPCGCVLQAHGANAARYAFRLCADVAGAALRVSALNWRPYAGPDQVHLLSVTLTGRTDLARLRLYVNAEPVLRAALQDALLMRASAAWVEQPGGALQPLHELPLRVAGLGEAGEHGWQVLRAWQCFPERFHFLELDCAALQRHLPPASERLTLHLALPVRSDSSLAHTLARAEAANLLTGCAPAVNQFPAAAAPVDVTGRASDYGLAPAEPSHVICWIDSVHLLRERALTTLAPPTEMRYGPPSGAAAADGGGPAASWAARRALPGEPGPPMRISFDPAAGSAPTTASIGLTCCDRAVPACFTAVEPKAALVSAVSRLREVEGGRALRWLLLAMLALEARPPDLESLRLALSLQDLAASETGRKLQAALRDVKTIPATLPLRHKHGAACIDGTEVRLKIDERALVGTSVALLAHVIDQYLSHSVHLNSFMQLVAVSAESGEELLRCRPRNGNLML